LGEYERYEEQQEQKAAEPDKTKRKYINVRKLG